MLKIPSLSLLLAATLACAACAKKQEAPAAPTAPAPAADAPAATPSLTSPAAPAGARVFFVDLKDGAEVTNPVTIKFGVEGIELAPAGEDKPNTGHHHLVIDAELPPANAPVPANDHYLHFGKAQTEATVTLTPGPHTLQLCFGNYLHLPFNPPLVSDKITVTVK